LVRVQGKILIDKWHGYGLMHVLTTIDRWTIGLSIVRYPKKLILHMFVHEINGAMVL